MIKINPLNEPLGRYFLDDPAREITDLGEESSPGQWLGRGSGRLGLDGSVEDRDFSAVLFGRPPSSTLRAPTRRQRVGFDVIVAAPKCVSTLFASTDRDLASVVTASHHRALEQVVSYLEQRALGISRILNDGQERETIGVHGIIGARFTHGISRSGDPHLHSHLVVANLAHGEDGRFGAIDARGLFAHRAAADALYRSHLRFELRKECSLSWELDKHGREQIQGISDATMIAFSGRKAEIRSGRRTRPAKEFISRDEAETSWSDRLGRAPLIGDLLRKSTQQKVLDEHHFSGMIYKDAIYPRRVVEAWAESARGGIDGRVVARALERLSPTASLGVAEQQLDRQTVGVSPSLLRMLGARPTDRDKLEPWWQRQEKLERALRSRELSDYIERAPKRRDRDRREVAR